MYVHAFIWMAVRKISRICRGLGECRGRGGAAAHEGPRPTVRRPAAGARRPVRRRGSAQLRTGPVEQGGRQVAQIALQLGIVGGGAQAGFIHVEFAVDLYLQAVTALRRLAEGTHQLNALVRVVDSNVVAALAQPGRDELTE